MADSSSLGQFEQLVLTAILTLGDNAYGVTIHAKAEALAAPKKAALGAVYATLDRIEDKGLVASWLSDPTPERAGGPSAITGRRGRRAVAARVRRDRQTHLRRRRTKLGRGNMEADETSADRPPLLIGLMRLLIPPPAREAVMGDLEERYRSPLQYASEGIRTMPYLIASRARRTSSVAIVGLQAFVLVACLGVTLPDLPGQTVPSWVRAAFRRRRRCRARSCATSIAATRRRCGAGCYDAVAAGVAMLLSPGDARRAGPAGPIDADWLLPRALYMLAFFALPVLWVLGAAEGRDEARPAASRPDEAVVQDICASSGGAGRNRAEIVALGLIVALSSHPAALRSADGAVRLAVHGPVRALILYLAARGAAPPAGSGSGFAAVRASTGGSSPDSTASAG